MYKGIIFDLDGTLLDTQRDLFNTINKTLKIHNFPIVDINRIRLNTGNGFRSLIRNCINDSIDEDMIDLLFDTFNKEYHLRYNINTKIYDGVVELLDYCINNNILISVNSNKKHQYTKALVNEYFSNYNFNDVIGTKEYNDRKPNPSNANFIINKMNLNKEQVCYIGDSEVDINTAINAKVDCIWVSWGFRSKNEVDLTKVRHIVDKPIEIIDILKKNKIYK